MMMKALILLSLLSLSSCSYQAVVLHRDTSLAEDPLLHVQRVDNGRCTWIFEMPGNPKQQGDTVEIYKR